MTEEEKKRQQQQRQEQKRKRQAAQAAAKARAQQQDAQAAEQAVANAQNEKTPEDKREEHKANVQTFLGNNRGSKMTTLDSVYQNAKPKEEYQAEVDAYNRHEQFKADTEWDKKVNESYKAAGGRVTKAGKVNPMLEGTSAETLFPELAKNGTIDFSASNALVTGTRQNLDPAKIASVQDLAHIASALTDEKDKYAVIDAYVKNNKLNADDVYWQVEQYSGNRVFSSPVSARGKATEIGVYNDYGDKLDPSKMTADQFWRAMELTYDSEDQATLLDAYKKLYPDYNVKGLKVPGFLESADMTKSEYDKRVDEMNAKFTVGASEANSNAYMDQLNALREEYAGNPRVLAQMERALLKSYERITNKKAPTNDEVQAAMEARAMEEKLAAFAGEKAAEKAEKTYWQVFDAQPDAPSSYGAAASEVDVEEVEPVEEATGYNYGGGGGGSASSYAAASGASMPTVNPSEQAGRAAANAAAEQEAVMAEANGVTPATASAERVAVVADALGSPLGTGGAWRNAPVTAGDNGAPTIEGKGVVKGGSVASTSGSGQIPSDYKLPYNPNMTDDEVLAAYSAGYVVDERNMAGLKPLLDNPNARGILMDTHGVYANVRQEGSGSKLVNMNQHYGYAIGSAASVLDNGSLPADLEGLGRRELASLVYEIDEGVRLGTITVPAGANQYAYAIAENEAYQKRVQRVADLQKEADAAYLEHVQKEKEAEETVIADIKARMMSGKPVSEAELGMVAEKYKDTRGDITDDETVLKYYRDIGKNKLFADSSEYWTRDSAAAQSAGVLLAQPRKSEFNKFRNVLYNETKNVVEDYARMALGMGVSLEELLVSAGLDEPSKLADVAYNNVIARGEAFSKDEEAQAAIEAINNAAASEHNALTATGLGARHGIEKYASGFAKTSYMILDDADYAEAVLDLEREYTAQYGDLGRYMYRKQLIDYANSGEMSQDAAADLLANISHARDIFDVGYELDPGFLEGFARNNYEAIQKDVEQLEAVASTLPSRLQKFFSGASSLAYSGAAMITSAAVGGIAGAAGASANVASTVGAAAGTGFPSYADAYTDNIQNKKMPPGLAKAMAFFEAAAMTSLNIGSTGVDIETFWGDSTYSLLKGAMTGKGGSSMIKLLGRWFSRSAGEGIQEDIENLIGKGFDAISDAAVMLESGRPVPLSKLCGSVMDNVYETDPVELFSELATDFGAGFAMSGVLSLAGAAKAFGQARTGANMQGRYSSIDLATQLVEGNLEFNEENVGKVYAALKQDMLDARFRKYIDSGHVAAVDQRANMIAVVMGTGEADRVKAVEYAQMAEEHSAKAEAARAARDAAQGTYWELRDRLASGDLSVQAALESARMQWQKAQTSLTEAESESSKALDNSKQAMEAWLTACRQQSGIVEGWMLEKQANNMLAARQAAAEKLAAQYEAEQKREAAAQNEVELAENQVFGADQFGRTNEDILATESDAEAEAEAVDVDAILAESEQLAQARDVEAATEEETARLEENEDAVFGYMTELMERARYALDELGDVNVYNEIAEQFNAIRDRFASVFGSGKKLPKMKIESESNAPAAETKTSTAKIPKSVEEARAKAAAEVAEAEAQAAKEAERTREVEMIEGAVFAEDEVNTATEAEEATDTDALIAQIADIQSRIDEAKNMGADADTIAALEAELEPLNAQKQKAIEAETREFDMLYDMQMAAAEADADDDYYQSLNDAYMASMDRLEAMGADVESIIARQSGKAEKTATTQETAQNTQEATQEADAPKVAKPRKIKPKKGKKETAAQRKQREQTESIRRRREATDAKLAEYKGASNFIAKTPIYVNESQEQEILRETGSKTLTEANGRYRARLTNNKKRTDAIPVENALTELVAEAGAIVDSESTTPEMELAKVMNAVQKLRDDRRQEWADARAIEEKKRNAKEKRRESVDALTGAESKPERQAKKINDVVESEGSTVEDIDRTINQIEGVSMSMNDGTEAAESSEAKPNAKPILEPTFEDPELQKLAQDLYNGWGIRLRLADLDPKDEGFYDRESKTIVLNKRLGTGERNRTVVVHELIHFCENEPWYDAFKRDIFSGAYANEEEIAKDRQRLREMGYAESELDHELVARAAKPLFGGDEVLIEKLINKGKITPVKRAYAAITQFIARAKAKKSGNLERYDHLASARKMLENGLKHVKPTEGYGASHSYTDMALSQYENDTAQEIDYIFKEVKNKLKGTEHEVRTDRAAIADAVKRIDDEGSHAVLDSLMNTPPDRWNSDDHVTAQVLLAKSYKDKDKTTQAMLAMVYGRARSEAGRALQKGKALQEITTQDILEYGAKENEKYNEKNGGVSQYAPVGNGKPLEKKDGVTGDAAKILDRAARVNRAVMETRNANDIDERKNIWGLALPYWKTQLIEEYGLSNTKLPGVHYNQATKKQRMLCAILATDTDVLYDTYAEDNRNGLLGLVQQLEAIKANKAVQTIADISYYTNKLEEAKALSNGAQNAYQDTDAAKTAFARAYDAVNNTVPVGFMSAKWRSAVAYMHMLSASTTGVKNVLANVVMKPLDLVSEGVATVVDKGVSKMTGNRTTTISNTQELRDSIREGLGEVLRTVADSYVYKADTSQGRKYDAMSGEQRVFQSDLAEGKRNMVNFIMQLGDRPFFRSEYVRQYDQIKRLVDERKMKKADTVVLEDGRKVTTYVDMTDADIHAEAAKRALESVFQSESETINWINSMPEKWRPFMTAIVPFVKTPTNVAKRMIDYSPVGLAKTIFYNGVWSGMRGKNFDQRAFVTGMGRGLTGTGMIFAGALLSSLGFIDVDDGYGSEEDGKLYNAGAADYEPYGVYINIGENRIALDWLSVAGIWLTVGAKVAKEIDINNAEDITAATLADALGKSMVKSSPEMLNLLFENTMLSSLSDLLGGAEDGESLGENLVETVGSSVLQQYFSPGDIRQFAKFTDEFDRDYRHDNPVIEAINKNVIRNWPVFRQMLPIKYDMTGDPVRQMSKYGWGKDDESVLLNFMNYYMSPTNVQTTKGDEALTEIVDLAHRIGNTGHIPNSFAKYDGKLTLTKDMAKASGLDYDAGEHVLILSAEEQYKYDKMYHDICFNGTSGARYAKIRGGSYAAMTGIRDFYDSYSYGRMSDEERAEKIKEINSIAYNIVREQVCIDRGYKK